jgi:hypothetical protein
MGASDGVCDPLPSPREKEEDAARSRGAAPRDAKGPAGKLRRAGPPPRLRRFVSRDRRAFKLRIQIHAGRPQYLRSDVSILTFSFPVRQLRRRAVTAPGRNQGRLELFPIMPTALASTSLLALSFSPLLAQEVDPRVSWNLRGNGGMLATAEQMARWTHGAT